MRCSTTHPLPAKDDGRFERQHAPRTDDARGDHDHDHRRSGSEKRHPGHVQAGQVRLGEVFENRLKDIGQTGTVEPAEMS